MTRPGARRLAERLGWPRICTSYPEQLSGGQQQRVAIARTLAAAAGAGAGGRADGQPGRGTADAVLALMLDLVARRGGADLWSPIPNGWRRGWTGGCTCARGGCMTARDPVGADVALAAQSAAAVHAAGRAGAGTALWSGVQAINAEARASYDAAPRPLAKAACPACRRTRWRPIPQETSWRCAARAGVSPVVEGGWGAGAAGRGSNP
jgi:hypothetical protein